MRIFRRLFPRRAAGAKAFIDRARALDGLGLTERALETYREALVRDPSSAQAHAETGGLLAELGRFEDAVRAYQRALELDAANAYATSGLALARTRLGDARMHAHDWAAALEHYRDAAAREPDDVDAIDGVGRALAALGRFDDAVAQFERAVALNPEGDSVLLLGMALREAARPSEAEPWLRRAVARHPRDTTARMELALCLVDLHRFDEALAGFDDVLHTEPDEIGALVGRGYVLSRLGRHAEAVAVFDRVLDLNPAQFDDAPEVRAADSASREACASGEDVRRGIRGAASRANVREES
jgi:tetratricopeptide (TPR) repeat protein